jgi:gluconate 2-dehydrogenase alpha chain
MKSVDAVIVGFGWTAALMAKELTDAGLNVVALERGDMRETATDAKFPEVADELKYSIRGALFQQLAQETVTIRHQDGETALPYRQQGSFRLGTGVGGAGFHWSGVLYRVQPDLLNIRTRYETRYGKKFIPDGMTIQDFGVTYDELEPYFTKFEQICGASGKAGNIRGQIMPGGNPLEAPRSTEFPTPPMQTIYSASLFANAAKEAGYVPAPRPSAFSSQAYTNPYGAQLGPCNFCGFCEFYGCYMYAKASPQTAVLPVLRQNKLFELRANSHVVRVNLDSTGKKATGVTYIDVHGNEVEQPADLVVLSAFQMHNVRLLLLSGIGAAYDPRTGQGNVGRNIAYQFTSGVNVLMPKGTNVNPFIGSGATGMLVDNFSADGFDHGPLGFVGGGPIAQGRQTGNPIETAGGMAHDPKWGKGYKAAVQSAYQRKFSIGVSGSVMAYRDNYISLDPTYKDAFGQPLLRMTFDWHDNEFKMSEYVTGKAADIAQNIGADKVEINLRKPGSHYDTRPYQSTHLTGGAIMGEDPTTSVINKYSQSWDVPNVFVYGASSFPQNMGYNPTGLIAALTLFSAQAIREQYLKNPGPLVQM